MDNITRDFTILEITTSFNDEVIWDNQMNLFDIYFKDEFLKNRNRLSLYDLEDLDFNDALYVLNSV